MKPQVKSFDPRQEMGRARFEIQHKRDTYLTDVALHHHDFYEVYYLVSGHVTYVIEGKLYRVMPGDMLLISPRELHQVYVRSEMDAYERFVLWIDAGFLRQLSAENVNLAACLDPSDPNFRNSLRLPVDISPLIRSLMERIYQESENEAFGAEMLCKSLIQQLLIYINRQVMQPGRSDLQTVSNPMIEDVVSYIRLHYGEPLSLDRLAEHFFVSKYHLSHEFQRHMGIGVHRYLQKKRLQIARQMLAQGEKPNAVYRKCGFSDYTVFYRAFKAEYDTNPKNFFVNAHQTDVVLDG